MTRVFLAGTTALILTACGQATDTPTTDVNAPEPTATETAVAEAPETTGLTLEAAAGGDWRSEGEKARDVWRNPVETLTFFEVAADETVVEIWPGGGWYTQILAPYLKESGQFIAAGFDPAANDFTANAMTGYAENFVANTDTYGDITVTVLSSGSEGFAEPGTVDTVLTFRNVHNWMAGEYAEKVFADMYAALKPGGIMGVVEHRLPSAQEQDPRALSGYVHEDYVKQLAAEAGFEFVEASEVNANPADTADHPFGVWTLPPVSRTSSDAVETPEDFDPAVYLAIGESDRMTLKFRKPVETTEE